MLCDDSRTTQLSKKSIAWLVRALVCPVAAIGTFVEAEAAGTEVTERHGLVGRTGMRGAGGASAQVELEGQSFV